MLQQLSLASAAIFAFVLVGVVALIIKCYKKAVQGEALIRTGLGDAKVSFSGIFIIPVIHRLEIMEISLKTVVISRTGKEGLICMDNMRADIKVTFFVKVNKTREDVLQVAQTIGCRRASDQAALENLFDAKFSEALKTVGKRFDFVELYNSRDKFKAEILQIIGTDLNGYILDDCAIDFLEQTPLESLNERNILDAEGIKKIIELTAKQKILSNQIEREKEKTITQQNVIAKEAVLELERQLAETEEKQKREIASIKAHEQAEIAIVQQNERLKSEKARISTDEELQVANENKYRQIIVAEKNKERTAKVETERVEKDRALEATERERLVTLAEIAKEKAIEEERKNIQEVIRERVAVQKSVVQEEERIKDTSAFAEADRKKAVAIKNAEMLAEEALVQQIKAADAGRQAAEYTAKQKLIEAEADQASASKRAEAMKIMADAEAVQAAAHGLSEARVMEAKAAAFKKQGEAEANVTEMKAVAEAKSIELTTNAKSESYKMQGLYEATVTKEKGLVEANIIELKAVADEKKGLVEAKILGEKMFAEAKGIQEKADAMKKLDGVGKDHEEFKLRLEKEKAIELAAINVQTQIADAQAQVISEALKSAKIDIVGGETMFFEKIMGSITKGKSIDNMVKRSDVLTEVKNLVLSPVDETGIKLNLKEHITKFGLSIEDIKNLSISTLILKMSQLSDNSETKKTLHDLLESAKKAGVANHSTDILELN
jgi:uncharacterized membrane protein YqiK